MSSPSPPPIPESLHADRLAEERKGEPQAAGPRLHRRGFLQAAGFSLAAAATGCHRPPLQSARPYLEAPEHVVPGRALHYASVCGGCSAACGTLVKVRDGRPIKMEGLDEHPGSRGGLCAIGQASLLGLYDALRIKGPRVDGRDVSWQEADAEIRQALASARRAGRAIRLLTPTLSGPTDRAAASRFIEATGGAHVVHDPLSASAILDAHRATHGRRVLPRYRFERADVVVSLDADFLGTWISPVEHASTYRRRRQADGPGTTRLSHHVQIESRLSLSGCNADHRLVVDPAELPVALAILEQAVAARSGAPARSESPRIAPARTLASAVEHELVAALEDLADLLWQNRADGGQTLVICDSDDVDAQILVNFLNLRLGGYGTTVDLERPSLQKQGDDRAFAELLAELRAGDVGVLLVAGVDPLHELEGLRLAEELQSVDLLVSLSSYLDATSLASGVVCPTPHFLESWGDAEPVAGWLAVRQPAIAPLFDSRSLRAGLDSWSAGGTYEDPGDLEALRDHWREEIHLRDPRALDFESFWNRTVHDGFVEIPAPATLDDPPETFDDSVIAAAAEAIAKRRAERPLRDGEFTLLLYPKVGLGDGRHADNPWLHELPDPVSKVTWGNYACLSPKAAADLGVSDGDIVRLTSGETHLDLPTLVQPGQHDSVVAVAMGYGDPRSARFRDVGPHWISSRPSTSPNGRVGVNGARLRNGLPRRRHGVTVEATGERRELACTQRWDRQDLPEETSPSGHGERHLVRDVSLASLAAASEEHGGGGGHHATLYPADHAPEDPTGRTTPHWGMTIDLDACTGCSACVVACQAENNCRWSATTRCGAIATCTGCASIATTTAMRRRRGVRRRLPAHALPALRPGTVRDRLSGAGHGADRGGPERPGLQPLRRHPLLRQQLPVQGTSLQLVLLPS